MNTPRELFENRPKITDEAAMQDLLEKTRVVSRVLQARKDRGNPDYTVGVPEFFQKLAEDDVRRGESRSRGGLKDDCSILCLYVGRGGREV